MDLTLFLTCERSMAGVRRIAGVFRAAFSPVLSRETIDPLEIALVELCTNAVEHAPESHRAMRLRLELSLSGDELRVQVIEPGAGFDPRRFARPQFASNDRSTLPTSGMGLALIHDTVDSVDYRTDGESGRVILVKRVRRIEDERAAERRADGSPPDRPAERKEERTR